MPFEDEDRYSAASVLVEKQTLVKFCERLCKFTCTYMNESSTSSNSHHNVSGFCNSSEEGMASAGVRNNRTAR